MNKLRVDLEKHGFPGEVKIELSPPSMCQSQSPIAGTEWLEQLNLKLFMDNL